MSLYKRKDSSFYWISFRINGRKLCASTKTSNRKLAERIHAQKRKELTASKWIEKIAIPKTPLKELMDRYMKEVSPSLSPTTDFRNSQIIKNLKAFFGNVRIGDIKSSTVSAYKAHLLEKGYSKETILKELGLLRRIFNIAIDEWEVCHENPVPKALRTLGRVDNKRVRYLKPDELCRLTAALPAWLKPIVTMARHTGLRRSNLLELTWSQVDSDKKILIIPKTKNSLPIGLPLTQTAAQTLTDIRHKRLTSSLVFCNGNGNPYSATKVSKAFLRASRRAKIDNLRFHDLRHDFASGLVQAGVPIHTVKELLGHRDLRMTVRYSHLAPENLREAVQVLDQRDKSSYVFTTVERRTNTGL